MLRKKAHSKRAMCICNESVYKTEKQALILKKNFKQTI